MIENDSNKIDEIDATILRNLLKEARTTFTEIAKECKISITGVRSRFLKLKKIGIINGAIMQVNPYSLGYDCMCDITMKTAPENDEKVKQFLRNKPYTKTILEQFGRQNIAIGVLLKSINELSGIMEDIGKCEHVKNVEPLIWTKPVHMDHPENLVIKPLNYKNNPEESISSKGENEKKIELDEMDIQIAKILISDARKPFRFIGKKLNIPTQTVIRKYDRLRKGVLTTSSITVNLQKLGYKAMARIFIKISNKSEERRIHSELLQIPNVIVAIRHVGIYNIRILIALEDFEDWFAVEEKIKKIDGITEMDISFDKAFTKWPLNIFANTLTEKTTQ
ncbi:MAG: AsnC family transcriptional regulator [Candidatus Bathyarchaeota archaeon]|nr:AsnC family transcriptional regulator [Candidatus Bathyarchaeum tardum]WNZ29293.1 MAG: AsnC family transcriptional regulator [Candidatus Bathyarchaeota archaeon]